MVVARIIAQSSYICHLLRVNRSMPRLNVVAVDLPGRRGKPGNLANATIGEWTDSVVADIDAHHLDDIVIVGHSMAGVTVPGVVAKLGSSRVREMILATAFVPRHGTAIVRTVIGSCRQISTCDPPIATIGASSSCCSGGAHHGGGFCARRITRSPSTR